MVSSGRSTAAKGRLLAAVALIAGCTLLATSSQAWMRGKPNPRRKGPADGIEPYPAKHVENFGNFRRASFKLGQRVKARYPLKLSNRGRGYYNEGGGSDVPAHLRDWEEDIAASKERIRYVEGGLEGTIVGILPEGEWENRPRHWKGYSRRGWFVNWDDATLPMDLAEEHELEVLDSELADKLRVQKDAEKAEKKQIRLTAAQASG
eukprot:TRINITY_DN427_c0_g1_i2.p1 TRINITY_DN427_c0_g1~~TRINITY_DN427_c0_g1_i2.p1  ORF type:complete len:206 (-),score=66.02 TRINITY_DN427_c0_g1_i2:156-773(-)